MPRRMRDSDRRKPCDVASLAGAIPSTARTDCARYSRVSGSDSTKASMAKAWRARARARARVRSTSTGSIACYSGCEGHYRPYAHTIRYARSSVTYNPRFPRSLHFPCTHTGFARPLTLPPIHRPCSSLSGRKPSGAERVRCPHPTTLVRACLRAFVRSNTPHGRVAGGFRGRRCGEGAMPSRNFGSG